MPLVMDANAAHLSNVFDGTPAATSSTLCRDDRKLLIRVAQASVSHGLSHRAPLPMDLAQVPPALQQVRATFVTLHIGDDLRGCIGTLEARRPLVADVAENAFAAAFRDHRFKPVTEVEFYLLHFHISILHPAEPMTVASEDDLLQQLRPGVDGLIMQEDARRATFLPDVWHSVREPRSFLAHLKQKAGLPTDYWSPGLRFWRYTTEGVD